MNVPQADPEQPLPDADQVIPALPTSFITVALNASVWAIARPPRFGEMVTLTVPLEDVTVIVALALLLVSRTDFAVNVTVGLAGTVAGAVYVTVVAVGPESAPHVGAQPPPDWDRAQVTPWFAGSLATEAVNWRVAETFSEALAGEIVTEMGGVTVIVAEAFLVPFETEVAVSVTVAGLGTLLGAR